MITTSVYVHFPWCLKKCPYCDFNSYATGRDEVPHEAYADALLRELASVSEGLSGRALRSVFFGGGTPSLWRGDALGRVLAAIRDAFPVEHADLEVTVECNPTSLEVEKVDALADAGVNRLSIGVQSLDVARLSFLGRLHDGPLALAAIGRARARFARVSGDLIFGLPGQSLPATLDDARALLDAGLDHVSAYSLTIEPGTQFGELAKKGKLPLAVDDDVAEAFSSLEQELARHGLAHYEVSNYAKPGQEARHNLHYWEGGDYLGLGAGAVGCLAGRDHHATRRRGEPLPDRYLTHAGSVRQHAQVERLTPVDRVNEALMLGLRTARGVDLEALEARTGIDVRQSASRAIERRIARGELELDGAVLRVPRRHWLALDSIVVDLFLEPTTPSDDEE